MAEAEKFVAKKPEKDVISLRIAVDTLREIDRKAAAIDISRNELINQMIAYALANMEETDRPLADVRPEE